MATKGEKDQVVDFAKYCDQRVRVRFQGGREVDGVLKGYDKLDNLVLEDAIEYLRGKSFNPARCEILLILICIFAHLSIRSQGFKSGYGKY